jgi:alkylation response protein AidB-like acyl-CoA dehydrogenase
VLFPRSDVEIVDTWHVSGLRGTGSHDMQVADLEVPAGRSGSLFTDEPLDAPLYAFPVFGLLAIAIAAVALGTARGALDDLAELAGAKTPTLSTRKLAARSATQSEVARAEAAVAGGRAFLMEAIDRAWDAATTVERAGPGAALPVAERTTLRMAATHATECSARAVDAAYNLAGGSAIYETAGPLQRRFRDVHAATQHMLVAPATWEVTGRALLGLEMDASQL